MIILIDGSSLLTTSYFATLPREITYEKDEQKKKEMYHKIMHAPDGRYTNGIYGMMKSLLGMLENQQPSHIFIAFDKTRNTFRRRMYAGYKAQRKETAAPLKEQFITVENMLKDCGFAVEYSDEFEADDLVGSAVEYCKKLRKENPRDKDLASIRLFTRDKDYFQLVDDATEVRLWMPMDKEKLEKNE